ncbi:MAG: hypothetical protein RBT76_07365 [candidate division Zixibacteria bacterium]|jgi:hypothetical protein|nr:hypothetical protein [candidate division Zixibacteria bacterium]
MRIEYSKTKPRTISLPLSTKYLKTWLDEHPAKGKPEAQLFPLRYDNMRMIVHRVGRRVLGKQVAPHLLRHSSATYYANRLSNRFKLCYRYGWAMSSKQVDRYIDRAGIMEEETAQTIHEDERSKRSRESESLREEVVMLREANATLSARFDEIAKELAELRDGRGVANLMLESLSAASD